MSHTDADRRTVPRGEFETAWAAAFPFDPYPQQVEGVERATDAMDDDGYLLLEGACGTGKTLIALGAGVEQLRGDGESGAERVVCVTPLKQQLRQFIEEVRAINREGSLEAPLDGLVLVGKADLLPYALADRPPFSELGAHEGAEETREATVELVKRTSDVPLRAGDVRDPDVTTCAVGDCDRFAYDSSVCPGHFSQHHSQEELDRQPWYDPVRARVVRKLSADLRGPRLEVGGARAPYPATPPHCSDVIDMAGRDVDDLPAALRGQFDPFYAGFYAAEDRPPFGFAAGPDNVLDPDALVANAVEVGVCPHAAMAELIPEAEVVVGNYYHAFDPRTRELTVGKAGVLGEETLLVVDEAHMIEERVRDLLSESVGLHTLRQARGDLTTLRGLLAGGRGPDVGQSIESQRTIEATLSEADLSREDLREAQALLEWLLGEVDREVREFLDDELEGSLSGDLLTGQLPREDFRFGLQPPDEPVPDRLSQRVRDPDCRGAPAFVDDPVEADFDPAVWSRLDLVGSVVERAFEAVEVTDREPVLGGVGHVLARWASADHESYFREVELDHALKDESEGNLPGWTRAYNASLSLYNCIPRERLAGFLDDCAGGILMSATLQPFDVFRDAVGLDVLASPPDPDQPPRRVETAEFGLQFPESNRASYVADLGPFTYRNRGERTTEWGAMTPTRQAYAQAVLEIARSPGNVLLGLPSYAEAEWAADTLAVEGVDKPVLLDRSSTARETDDLLDSFFADDDRGRVLVTSLRGTVTEGVDYEGDRLHTAAVVGVPYARTTDERVQAVRAAYDARFDGDGFEYAVAVPAVRKARQAVGRVIRGHDERGVRVLVDGRYGRTDRRGVAGYLAADEREEFRTVSGSMLTEAIDRFWRDRRTPFDAADRP
ncbi:MAG: ATP-dependent DNA helicase [Haloarculaceae archaeon]